MLPGSLGRASIGRESKCLAGVFDITIKPHASFGADAGDLFGLAGAEIRQELVPCSSGAHRRFLELFGDFP